MHFGRICAAVHCCRSLGEQQILKLDVAVPQALLPVNLGAKLLKQTWQCYKPAVKLLSAQQLYAVKDALWQELYCSALLLVVVPLCEQQTVTVNLQ